MELMLAMTAGFSHNECLITAVARMRKEVTTTVLVMILRASQLLSHGDTACRGVEGESVQ
jgi:hypothetical protein